MFVGMPLVPLLCLLYGDPMLKNLRSLFYKIQWGHKQTISQCNEITMHHQNNVHHQSILHKENPLMLMYKAHSLKS